MNICVLGAGAIGGWVAAKLALAGERVTALTSRGPLDQIQLIDGDQTHRVELTPFDGPADVLVLATKATSLRRAASAAATFLAPETIILPMLNGAPWWIVEGQQLRPVDPVCSVAAALTRDQV